MTQELQKTPDEAQERVAVSSTRLLGTPRTEAEVARTYQDTPTEIVPAWFARQLEKELLTALEISKKYEDRYFVANSIARELVASGDPKPWKIAEWNNAKAMVVPNAEVSDQRGAGSLH